MELQRPRVTTVFAVLAMALLGGCVGPFARGSSRDYSITVNRDTYSRGDVGEAQIKNVSGKTLEYNLCQRRLERKAGNYWVVTYEWPTAGGSCTTDMTRLDKDQSVKTLFEIPRDAPIDTYRVLFTSLRGRDGKTGGPDEAATATFKVR